MNLEKLKQKQMKLKRGGKKIMKIGMKRERGYYFNSTSGYNSGTLNISRSEYKCIIWK